MKKYIFLIIIALQSTSMLAQYLSNSSFEGPPGLSLSPPDWVPFDLYSTPDTEPLECDDFPASDGDTYITLVARGSLSSHSNSVENCQAQLLKPLEAGSCYTLSLDLASRDDLGHYVTGEGFKYYTSTVSLRIYGSNSVSEKGILMVTIPDVTNQGWETFSYNIKPEEEIQFLLLEIGLSAASTIPGNMLIDNLILEDVIVESTVVLNETYNTSDLPITLQASESSSYSWTPNTGLSCYDCRSPEVNSNISRTYTCNLLSSTSGCPAVELFILQFEDDPVPPGDFKIPNVFTPNGDEVNDNFVIEGLPPYSSLIIFNRSGKELYRSEEYNNEWDGTDKDNNPLPSDTYWYVLVTPGLSGKHKGYVYLKRD
ncbi:MAG: gliding motility-associated C-terminal domain-containing protein [Bacteroidales bacterium]|nr:gliding motility-associated C-terminal domain-containing protein [Bacteroidales bacterium]